MVITRKEHKDNLIPTDLYLSGKFYNSYNDCIDDFFLQNEALRLLFLNQDRKKIAEKIRDKLNRLRKKGIKNLIKIKIGRPKNEN